MRIARTHAVALFAATSMATWVATYCTQIYLGEVVPNPITWILIAAAVTMGTFTHKDATKEERPSLAARLISNTTNTVDVVAIWAVLFSVLALSKRVRIDASWFEIGCLVMAALIFLYYRVGKRPWSANIAVNALLTVAYFPTYAGLLASAQNTETYSAWLLGLMTSVAGILNASDTLARLYAWRATLCVSVVLVIMLARFPPWQ